MTELFDDLCLECDTQLNSDGTCPEGCLDIDECSDCGTSLCPDGSCPCCDFGDDFEDEEEEVSDEELDLILLRLGA